MAKLVLGTDINNTGISSIVVEKQVPIPTGKYTLLQRVSDDSNNPVGTVACFCTDSNDVEYAIVVLDAQYRLKEGKYASSNVYINDLEPLQSISSWENKYTATSNCDKILAQAASSGFTSTSVLHCRSKSFMIDGITYYGQLPTLFELMDILKHRTVIGEQDPSLEDYSNLVIPAYYGCGIWTSNQRNGNNSWVIAENNLMYAYGKTNNYFVLPILELPNAIA